MNIHKVYVTLDSLLDTRLAVLGDLSEEITTELLVSNKWHSRRTNRLDWIYSSIRQDLFESRFKERDVETLKKSVMTSMVPLLADLAVRTCATSGIQGEHTAIELTINSYPYKLTTVERNLFKEVLLESIQATDLNWVSLPLMAETPGMLAIFDTIIMHDFDPWVTAFNRQLEGGIMERSEVYFPEDVRKDYSNYLDQNPTIPAKIIAAIFSGKFTARLCPLKLYSILPVIDES